MKRILLILLAVLLLAGCSKQKAAETTAATTTVPTETATEPIDPELLEYPLEGAYQKLISGSDGLYLLSGANELIKLDPQDCSVAQTLAVAELIPTADGGLYNYDAAALTLTDLQTGTQWTLPADTAGAPLVSSLQGEIYYCTAGQVRALSIQTGISRLVMSHSFAQQSLMGLYFQDEVLGLRTENGARLISVENGQIVHESMELQALHTLNSSFLGLEADEGLWRLVCGTTEGSVMQFDLTAENYAPALSMGGVVLWNDSALDYYELETGLHTAGLTLSGTQAAVCHEGYIWILTADTLYRWDVNQSPVSDDTVYTSARYTASAPDTDGLAQCQSRVDALNETYGVQIRIWEQALEQTGGHRFEAEFRVDEIEADLDALETALARFPEGFLAKTVPTGWVCVNLVRSIDETEPFVQYWADGDCHIAISGTADLEEAFYTGLGWGVDSKILGNSRDLEYWNDLNPHDFSYDGDYALSQARDDAEYLEGEERFFADKRSMAFPTEDRARIFYYAMTEGNEELFASSVLQKKLKLICDGIREAYGLKKYEESLPWEQYLT